MKKYVLRLMNLSNDFRIKFDLITTSTFFGYTTSSFHCNCKIIIVELYAPIETPSSNRYLCKLIFVSLGVCHQNQEVIEMKDKSISLEIFKIVMDSIYTGDLHVNQKNVFEVLLAASQLQMASVFQLCCDFVKKEFIENRTDLKNYSVLCTVAVRLGLRDLQEAAEVKMASIYKDVCETKEFLTQQWRSTTQPSWPRRPQFTLRNFRLQISDELDQTQRGREDGSSRKSYRNCSSGAGRREDCD